MCRNLQRSLTTGRQRQQPTLRRRHPIRATMATLYRYVLGSRRPHTSQTAHSQAYVLRSITYSIMPTTSLPASALIERDSTASSLTLLCTHPGGDANVMLSPCSQPQTTFHDCPPLSSLPSLPVSPSTRCTTTGTPTPLTPVGLPLPTTDTQLTTIRETSTTYSLRPITTPVKQEQLGHLPAGHAASTSCPSSSSSSSSRPRRRPAIFFLCHSRSTSHSLRALHCSPASTARGHESAAFYAASTQ